MVDTGEDGVPGGGQVAAADGGDAWQKNEQFPLDSKITFLGYVILAPAQAQGLRLHCQEYQHIGQTEEAERY